MKSVISEPTRKSNASALPWKKERFGFPYTTLKADSSTLNSESDPHRTNTAPTIPSAVALSWICSTTRTMLSTDVSGNVLFSSVTRKLDSSARPKRPSMASARNSSGTNESSAK